MLLRDTPRALGCINHLGRRGTAILIDNEISSSDLYVYFPPKKGFTFKDLVEATNNFHESYVIGNKASETVYKAVMDSGLTVTVKILASNRESKSNNIPVLDLEGHDRNEIIQQITKASQEFGFFQVINHGVSKELMDETRNVVKEFHAMSAKEKFLECPKDPQ
ncbi:hypothetical protein EZV62_000487 [Acer yangbiense]|uniref:Non-haem dioxygenase N-terminal domain-containing protein n=1 Tax=Acer yangbiense TaxID=1000413 RepID=A0A5C7IS03_9ROSI|nr:hypothetical protein EZV62_000487 [Acer yangbiense]